MVLQCGQLVAAVALLQRGQRLVSPVAHMRSCRSGRCDVVLGLNYGQQFALGTRWRAAADHNVATVIAAVQLGRRGRAHAVVGQEANANVQQREDTDRSQHCHDTRNRLDGEVLLLVIAELVFRVDDIRGPLSRHHRGTR